MKIIFNKLRHPENMRALLIHAQRHLLEIPHVVQDDISRTYSEGTVMIKSDIICGNFSNQGYYSFRLNINL